MYQSLCRAIKPTEDKVCQCLLLPLLSLIKVNTSTGAHRISVLGSQVLTYHEQRQRPHNFVANSHRPAQVKLWPESPETGWLKASQLRQESKE